MNGKYLKTLIVIKKMYKMTEMVIASVSEYFCTNWVEIRIRRTPEMKLHYIVCVRPKMLKLLHSSKDGRWN